MSWLLSHYLKRKFTCEKEIPSLGIQWLTPQLVYLFLLQDPFHKTLCQCSFPCEKLPAQPNDSTLALNLTVCFRCCQFDLNLATSRQIAWISDISLGRILKVRLHVTSIRQINRQKKLVEVVAAKFSSSEQTLELVRPYLPIIHLNDAITSPALRAMRTAVSKQCWISWSSTWTRSSAILKNNLFSYPDPLGQRNWDLRKGRNDRPKKTFI